MCAPIAFASAPRCRPRGHNHGRLSSQSGPAYLEFACRFFFLTAPALFWTGTTDSEERTTGRGASARKRQTRVSCTVLADVALCDAGFPDIEFVTSSHKVGGMSSLSTVVAPVVGVILANCMFVSPLKEVLAAREKGNLGCINPLPFLLIFSNCPLCDLCADRTSDRTSTLLIAWSPNFLHLEPSLPRHSGMSYGLLRNDWYIFLANIAVWLNARVVVCLRLKKGPEVAFR